MSNEKYRVEQRTFQLDCARKYFTPAWFKSLIREIASAGFNTLLLNFTEDMAVRLESKQYPWLAGGDHTLCGFGAANGRAEDDGKVITQDEMTEIVKFAQSNGIDVVPALNTPGHMNYAVKKYNEHYGCDIGNYFHKNGEISIVQGSSFFDEEPQKQHSRGIDIANPEAVAFAKSLYMEYGKFFRDLGCTRFHIGADEMLGFGETIDSSLGKWNNLDHWEEYARKMTGNPNAVAYDAFVLYVNEIYDLLRSLGYEEISMANDDAYRSFDTGWTGVADINKNFTIQFWTPAANNGKNTALFYLDKGHSLYNFSYRYTYYVLGFTVTKKINAESYNTTPEEIEAKWNPYLFDPDVPENNPTAPDSRVKRSGFSVWCDVPAAETEEELLEHLKPYIAVVGKKLCGE